MPIDPEPKPPTLDYQPVTKGRRRIPIWLVVFVVAFVVGAVWPVVVVAYVEGKKWDWVFMTLHPGIVVGDFVDRRAGRMAAWGSCCVTLGMSYGVLAQLGYAVFRALRRRQEENA